MEMSDMLIGILGLACPWFFRIMFSTFIAKCS
jgi:hypothetical protein